jgi:type VI secretion system protein ImpL
MNRILEILSIFKQGRITSFVGILALSALIWFLGSSLGFGKVRPLAPELNRMIVIAVLFTLWLLNLLWTRYRAKKKNQAMLDKLGQDSSPSLSPDELSSQEELGHLSTRLEEALSALKNTKIGKEKQKQFLYQLPWYIIIGPPGAGKTTLLSNSNLHFPLSDKFGREALRGVGGTRDCDWWFTDDAILLDTAGRYTTQDSNAEVDQTAWLGFLNLLKEHRKQQPINGVIIAVSLSDILQQTAQERLKHAQNIRQRIEELHKQLTINFPIYIMFTKADLVAGFNEFFDDLNKSDREQVWGMTFNADSNTGSSEDTNTGFNSHLFKAEFSLLEQQIHRQLLEKLEHERNLKRRQALYIFPQQFSSLQTLLSEFLEASFKSSNFQHNALLRGVYFSSATQEGSPIDRIMGSLATQFGIGRQSINRFSAKGKSFFINHLLGKVIFPESGLAGTNLKLKKKMQWLYSVASIATIVVSLIVVMIWFNSYHNNQKIIANYQSEVDKVKQLLVSSSTQSDISAQLPLLNTVRQLTATYSDNKKSVPLSARWGLSQRQALAEQMDIKYIELLRNTLQPHSKQLLEKLIRSSQNDAGKLFSLLKVYLFLAGKKPQGTSIPMVEADWNINQNSDVEDSQLNKHFMALLRNSSSENFALDKTLVQQSRSILENADMSQLAYENLKTRYSSSKDVPDFKLIEQEGLREINQSFQRKSNKAWSDGIPGLFTKQGFYQIFLKNYTEAVNDLQKDSWVLGKASYTVQGSIEQSVLKNYQQDYINYWDGLIYDLSIRPLGSKAESLAILEPLTPDGNNLILKLLQAIKKETDFNLEKDEKFLGIKLGLKEIPKNVNQHFKELNQWADAEKFKKITDLLNEVFVGFNIETAFGAMDENQVKFAVEKLQAKSLNLPGALKQMLFDMTEQAKNKINATIINNMKKQLASDMEENVGAICRQNIVGKYPFARKSSQFIQTAAFVELFASNGAMDSFVKNNLKKNTQFPPEQLSAIYKKFAKADTIRKAFFSQGSLGFIFSLQLVKIKQPFYSIDVSIGNTSHTFMDIGDSKSYTWSALSMGAISTDFLDADPNADPPAPDLNAIVDPLNPMLDPNPVALPSPDVEVVEKVNEKITAGRSAWELFKLVKSNKEIHMSGAVFKVTSNTRPNPFSVIKSDIPNFKCPTL